MILAALIVSIVISAASFAYGYSTAGHQVVARWVAVFGVVWLVSHWRKWRWFPTPAIFISLLLAAFGVWFEFHYGWMFSGAAFALIAYDLGEFGRKLGAMPPNEDIPGMARRHLIRIGILALCAALISLLAAGLET